MSQIEVGYGNLDWGRSIPAQIADVVELYGRVVLALFAECKVDLRSATRGHVAQPTRRREALVSHRALLAKGSRRASRRSFGHRIGARRFVWAVPDLPAELPRTAFVLAHMPPKRMWGPLYAAYVASLVLLVRSLRRQGYEVVVIGDWNKRVRRDPAGLRSRFKGRLLGERIDGCWASPGIAKHIVGWREEKRPGRTDNHPFCILTLEA